MWLHKLTETKVRLRNRNGVDIVIQVSIVGNNFIMEGDLMQNLMGFFGGALAPIGTIAFAFICGALIVFLTTRKA